MGIENKWKLNFYILKGELNMKNNNVINTVIGIAGLVGIGYALCARTKLAKVGERLDKGIEELANDMEFDIPEELVNKAIEKAVRIEVKKAVEKATNETVIDVKRSIRSDVQRAVDREYDTIKETVLKELSSSASKIDVSRVRRDVEEAAKEAALEKFDDNLDDILEKFNDNLENTSKIYSSIREAITKSSDSSKEFVVRLN